MPAARRCRHASPTPKSGAAWLPLGSEPAPRAFRRAPAHRCRVRLAALALRLCQARPATGRSSSRGCRCLCAAPLHLSTRYPVPSSNLLLKRRPAPGPQLAPGAPCRRRRQGRASCRPASHKTHAPFAILSLCSRLVCVPPPTCLLCPPSIVPPPPFRTPYPHIASNLVPPLVLSCSFPLLAPQLRRNRCGPRFVYTPDGRPRTRVPPLPALC